MTEVALSHIRCKKKGLTRLNGLTQSNQLGQFRLGHTQWNSFGCIRSNHHHHNIHNIKPPILKTLQCNIFDIFINTLWHLVTQSYLVRNGLTQCNSVILGTDWCTTNTQSMMHNKHTVNSRSHLVEFIRLHTVESSSSSSQYQALHLENPAM
jgi:hypothetical protein